MKDQKKSSSSLAVRILIEKRAVSQGNIAFFAGTWLFWRFFGDLDFFAPQEPASQACSLSPCRACDGLPGGFAIGTMRLASWPGWFW